MSLHSRATEALSAEVVDMIFARLAATYGRYWPSMWDGLEAAAVHTVWAHELAVFARAPHRINWALDNLPERCPNAIEFKSLCRQAPAPEQKKLPMPQASASVARAEKEKQQELRRTPITPNPDWHKAILARHKAGGNVSPGVLKMAKEAGMRALVSHGA